MGPGAGAGAPEAGAGAGAGAVRRRKRNKEKVLVLSTRGITPRCANAPSRRRPAPPSRPRRARAGGDDDENLTFHSCVSTEPDPGGVPRRAGADVTTQSSL